MCVKIFNGKRFHVIKQVFSQSPERALIDMDHDHLLCKCCRDTDSVKARNSPHCTQKRTVVRIRSTYHRSNVCVDQSSREHCALNISQYRDDNTDQDYDHLYAIVSEHITEHPL